MKVKDFGFRGPTPKQVGQVVVADPAVGVRLSREYPGAAPIHGRFRYAPSAAGYLDVRDPAGLRPPFAPPLLGRDYGRPRPIAVRLRDQFIMELNVFAGGMPAVGPFSGARQRAASEVMDSGTGFPILGVAGVEAAVPRGSVARLATTVAELRDPTTVRVARKTLVSLPEASSRAIVGGQSCVVMTSRGPSMLAAYRARWSASSTSASIDELWLVELSPSGAVALSRGPAVPAGTPNAPLTYPAITTGLRGDLPVASASSPCCPARTGIESVDDSRSGYCAMTRLCAVLCVVVMGLGCDARSHVHDDVPSVDAGRRLDVPARDCGVELAVRGVGVLFVIQSFGATYGPRTYAQYAVGELFPVLRQRTDGVIRFGAITGDSGPGGIIGNGCAVAGRDGVLLDGSERGEPAPSSILTLAPADPIEPFLDAALGLLDDAYDDECVNQVLESTLRAITPTTVPVSLPAHGSVHGDRETAGLVEPGDVLLVVFVTDAEDCSWSESVLADPPDGRLPFCEGTDRCCAEVLYPSAERYVPAFRAAAEALQVDLAFALISAVPEADVSLAEWRARGAPDTELCGGDTPSIYRDMPWRIFETLDAFEPFVTTQPRCDPDYEAIADVVSNVACGTRP